MAAFGIVTYRTKAAGCRRDHRPSGAKPNSGREFSPAAKLTVTRPVIALLRRYTCDAADVNADCARLARLVACGHASLVAPVAFSTAVSARSNVCPQDPAGVNTV